MSSRAAVPGPALAGCGAFQHRAHQLPPGNAERHEEQPDARDVSDSHPLQLVQRQEPNRNDQHVSDDGDLRVVARRLGPVRE